MVSVQLVKELLPTTRMYKVRFYVMFTHNTISVFEFIRNILSKLVH